jgi:acetyl/propionyl-CoA carboxylase alpha subunit
MTVAQVSVRKDTPDRPFARVLIANRGEIAVRIIRACRELGIEAVAVYSDADADAMHVRLADEAIRLGPSPPLESYLRIDAVIDAAVRTDSEAIHPGYGFLAESADFARACESTGVVLVGPTAATIEALGDKLAARRVASSVGVAPVAGTPDAVAVDGPDDVPAILGMAEAIGYPLMIKAAAGGGGRGMRRVDRADDLVAALPAAAAEAASAFGAGAVYLERLISPARHIEVQLLGDASGRVVAIGERDCSLQRRHQKLVEEAPAPGLSIEQRRAMHGLAARVGEAAGLRNAATAEFLVDEAGAPWFLEVNTRLQVEHGVTELVTGLDIVREQLWLAAGRPLSSAAMTAAERAADVTGHAIEVRISAEDPGRSFAPTPGRIGRWAMPSGPGVRVDTGIESGDRVPPEYDNLIAKLLVHADDRAAAIARLAGALDETQIGGIQTTLPFHRFVATDEAFRAGDVSTAFVSDRWEPVAAADRERAWVVAAAAVGGAVEEGRLVTAKPRTDGVAATESGWRRACRAAAVERWPGAELRPSDRRGTR